MKIYPYVRLIYRLIILLVAVGLFIAGVYNAVNYFRDRNVAKTEVTATVVQKAHDSDSVSLLYHFDKQTIQAEPIGKIIYNYGRIGQKMTVYVDNNNPARVFLTQHPMQELQLAGALFGWSILLGLIILAERRILQILRSKE